MPWDSPLPRDGRAELCRLMEDLVAVLRISALVEHAPVVDLAADALVRDRSREAGCLALLCTMCAQQLCLLGSDGYCPADLVRLRKEVFTLLTGLDVLICRLLDTMDVDSAARWPLYDICERVRTLWMNLWMRLEN